MEQPAHGLEVWIQPFVPLRAPKLFNLRSDPFERRNRRRATTSNGSSSTSLCWFRHRRSWGQFLATFQEFPPRQKPGSFSVDQAMEKMMNQKGNN